MLVRVLQRNYTCHLSISSSIDACLNAQTSDSSGCLKRLFPKSQNNTPLDPNGQHQPRFNRRNGASQNTTTTENGQLTGQSSNPDPPPSRPPQSKKQHQYTSARPQSPPASPKPPSASSPAPGDFQECHTPAWRSSRGTSLRRDLARMNHFSEPRVVRRARRSAFVGVVRDVFGKD